ncbi:MAG: hypothetical protein JWP58_1582 [Hymenobacter sp.]|nr:hypothetical protein [Hymenobacter sp.]
MLSAAKCLITFNGLFRGNQVLRCAQHGRYLKLAFLQSIPTLQPQTHLIMLQTRYFFGYYTFYATA